MLPILIMSIFVDPVRLMFNLFNTEVSSISDEFDISMLSLNKFEMTCNQVLEELGKSKEPKLYDVIEFIRELEKSFELHQAMNILLFFDYDSKFIRERETQKLIINPSHPSAVVLQDFKTFKNFVAGIANDDNKVDVQLMKNYVEEIDIQVNIKGRMKD